MPNSSSRFTLSAFALAAFSALAVLPASADDAMKADPTKSGAMETDTTKAGCMAKAAAETDAARKQDMMTECDKMTADAMKSGEMENGAMQGDAMAPKTK